MNKFILVALAVLSQSAPLLAADDYNLVACSFNKDAHGYTYMTGVGPTGADPNKLIAKTDEVAKVIDQAIALSGEDCSDYVVKMTVNYTSDAMEVLTASMEKFPIQQ